MSFAIGNLLKLVRRFAHHTNGSIAVQFALASIPIVLAVGAGIDYSFANRAQAKLNALADAAALAAVNLQNMASQTAAQAQTTAQNMFTVQASGIPRVTVGTVSATVTDSGLGRTSVVSYTATVPTSLMGVMGMKTMTVKGTSTASTAVPSYIDFYLLLDNTPSMGVGATPSDVATMVNNTPDQCAFACHDLNDNNNYYKLAKSLGVTMRIDVVRTATQQLMDTATALQSLPNQFRVAIYTFGATAATAGLTTIAPLSSNLSTAKTLAGTIDLMTVNGQGQNNDQDTNYDSILPAMNTLIPIPGPGTVNSPQKVLFFVSDGVADEANSSSCTQPTTGGRCQEPITPSLCAAIKNRGIFIAVLYTTYLPLPTNAWYNSWIKPFTSQISTNMQTCASPGLYFEVSPTQGISQAMQALFQKAVASARLTK